MKFSKSEFSRIFVCLLYASRFAIATILSIEVIGLTFCVVVRYRAAARAAVMEEKGFSGILLAEVGSMVSAYVHILVWAFILVPAALGGWFGWRFGTRGLYVRSIGADISNEEMSRSLLMRRRALRIGWTLLGAVIGAVVGAVFLMGLARAR